MGSSRSIGRHDYYPRDPRSVTEVCAALLIADTIRSPTVYQQMMGKGDVGSRDGTA